MLPALTLAGGGVTSSTNEHHYGVGGTTPAALVRYMNSHAIDGDRGHAYANIHPNYRLSLTTGMKGGVCKPTRVGVDIDFDLTLPVASQSSAMSNSTRRAWNAFAAFARGHEMHHKASYIECAGEFVLEARQQSSSACFALEQQLRTLFADIKRDCETRQIPFDRQQAGVLARQPLFTLARR